MQGFKDIISSATGGDTVQIWLQTNGYAFTRKVFCEFEVIMHDGQHLKITPVVAVAAEPENKDEQENKAWHKSNQKSIKK